MKRLQRIDRLDQFHGAVIFYVMVTGAAFLVCLVLIIIAKTGWVP